MPLVFSIEHPEAIKELYPEYKIVRIGKKEKLSYNDLLGTAYENGEECVIIPLISRAGLSETNSFEQACKACAGFLSDHETSIIISTGGKRIKTGKFDMFAEKRADERAKKNKTSYVFGAQMMKAAACVPRNADVFTCEEAAPFEDPLHEYIKNADKGFSETLLELIDKSGMTDVQCYKRANVDRKLFSKIRSSPDYRPKKTTALSFCIALSLSLEQTKSLLEKAGFALSKSNKGDLIVEYFITHGKYDIYEINEALFEYDQALLGA